MNENILILNILSFLDQFNRQLKFVLLKYRYQIQAYLALASFWISVIQTTQTSQFSIWR